MYLPTHRRLLFRSPQARKGIFINALEQQSGLTHSTCLFNRACSHYIGNVLTTLYLSSSIVVPGPQQQRQPFLLPLFSLGLYKEVVVGPPSLLRHITF